MRPSACGGLTMPAINGPRRAPTTPTRHNLTPCPLTPPAPPTAAAGCAPAASAWRRATGPAPSAPTARASWSNPCRGCTTYAANLERARTQYRQERHTINQQGPAHNQVVVAAELSHNAAGRAFTLLWLYQHLGHPVALLGRHFPRWGRLGRFGVTPFAASSGCSLASDLGPEMPGAHET